MAPLDAAETLERCQFVADLLDEAIPVPGTDRRVGLDSIVGVLPVAGDAVTAVASSYIVLEAARLGAPKATVARMTVNVVVDFLFGAIPLLGDLFDAVFKANQKNVALLEAHLGEETVMEAVADEDEDEATTVEIEDSD
ncbi:DUF4112 domain-containing protein [Halomarina rubra]|uniref:DUF4112 domain-containing protein n=1 Tax=Halomarina rubra TaxID=2071873 RepID=A0ABD6ARH2_9EURY|nr:DUF4112 domain-containing protein [Halomarina rubra]